MYLLGGGGGFKQDLKQDTAGHHWGEVKQPARRKLLQMSCCHFLMLRVPLSYAALILFPVSTDTIPCHLTPFWHLFHATSTTPFFLAPIRIPQCSNAYIYMERPSEDKSFPVFLLNSAETCWNLNSRVVDFARLMKHYGPEQEKEME